MEKFTIDMSAMNDFVKAWHLDAIANSAHKGVQTNQLKAAELLSEAREITKGDDANAEFAQDKLNRLATRIAMHEEQEGVFQTSLDHAAQAWVTVTGKKAWTPYAASNTPTMDKTAANAFFSTRL
jgi:hypothetical protein